MIDYPTTKEEAEKWEYGHRLDKIKYDSSRCAWARWDGKYMKIFQCLRKPGYGPDKLYCKQHAKIIDKKATE